MNMDLQTKQKDWIGKDVQPNRDGNVLTNGERVLRRWYSEELMNEEIEGEREREAWTKDREL